MQIPRFIKVFPYPQAPSITIFPTIRLSFEELLEYTISENQKKGKFSSTTMGQDMEMRKKNTISFKTYSNKYRNFLFSIQNFYPSFYSAKETVKWWTQLISDKNFDSHVKFDRNLGIS